VSTQINVTVGSGGLSDKARQLQTAARQAQLEKERQQRIETQGQEQRTANLAAAGRAPDGTPLYGPGFKQPEIERRPAANRSQAQTIVNGVGVQISYSTQVGDNVDWTVRVKIGAVNGTDITEFVYPYRTNDWFAPAPSSGFPSDWKDVPFNIGIPFYSTSQPAFNGVFLDGYRFLNSGSLGAAAFDAGGGSYTVTIDSTVRNDINNSQVFALPDGKGGTYIIFVLNRLHSVRISRTTKTLVSSWTLRSQEVFRSREGQLYDVVWTSNPGCSSSSVEAAEADNWLLNNAGYYYTGRQSLTSSYEYIKDIEFSDYSVHLYKVNKNNIEELNVPTALAAWMQQLFPPLDWTGESNILPSGTVGTDSVLNSGIFERSTTDWDGTHTNNCFPTIQDQVITILDKQPIAYPTFNFSTYLSNTGAYSPDLSSLIFTLGGVSVSSPRAFGPSFPLSYNKDIKSLTTQQRYSYEYMEDTFFGKKPEQYVAKCVLPGSCTAQEEFSVYDITWYQSKERPPAYGQLAPAESYSLVKNGSFVTASQLRSGFSIYWTTNWGSNSLCRQILKPLGL
jgi:hypothetical protein